MFVLGKLFGAFLGVRLAVLFLGSPIVGLISGIIIGHAIDCAIQKKMGEAKAKRYWQARFQAELNERFMRSLFSMFGKLCYVDGPLTPPEVAQITKVTNEMLRMPRKSKKLALELFRSAVQSPSSFQYDAAQFYELQRNDPNSLEGMVDLLFSIAAADGPIVADEERLVYAAAQIFNLPEQRYREISIRYGIGSNSNRSSNGGTSSANNIPQIKKFYDVLGCTPDDSIATIKQNYRKLVADYHPDKIVSKELPADFIKFATDKFKDIQEAYDAIKKDKKF